MEEEEESKANFVRYCSPERQAVTKNGVDKDEDSYDVGAKNEAGKQGDMQMSAHAFQKERITPVEIAHRTPAQTEERKIE